MDIERLIYTGRYDEARQRIGLKNPNRVPHPLNCGPLLQSIAAHMCCGRFVEAAAMCDRFNELYPRYVSTSYTYGGMIRWFEKRRRPAAAIWESGLKCGYTSYCGMDCALLLWYASIRSPTLQVMQAAVDRMRQPYYARQRAGYLVDSLVRYLLDEIDEATLREAGVDPRWENQTLLNKACIEFYVAAKHFERGNRRGFARHVSRCAEAAGLYTISPELLLARHEVGMLPFQFPAGGYRHQLHPEVMGRLKRNRRKSDS